MSVCEKKGGALCDCPQVPWYVKTYMCMYVCVCVCVCVCVWLEREDQMILTAWRDLDLIKGIINRENATEFHLEHLQAQTMERGDWTEERVRFHAQKQFFWNQRWCSISASQLTVALFFGLCSSFPQILHFLASQLKHFSMEIFKHPNVETPSSKTYSDYYQTNLVSYIYPYLLSLLFALDYFETNFRY